MGWWVIGRRGDGVVGDRGGGVMGWWVIEEEQWHIQKSYFSPMNRN